MSCEQCQPQKNGTQANYYKKNRLKLPQKCVLASDWRNLLHKSLQVSQAHSFSYKAFSAAETNVELRRGYSDLGEVKFLSFPPLFNSPLFMKLITMIVQMLFDLSARRHSAVFLFHQNGLVTGLLLLFNNFLLGCNLKSMLWRI